MALSPASTQPIEITTEEVIQTSTETVEAPTEPIEIITEEVIQTSTETVEAPTEPFETSTEEVIYPSLIDELAPEIVDNIIAELRKDSNLKDIITEMEQQIQIEEGDLDIDIPDLADPLEDELENLLW